MPFEKAEVIPDSPGDLPTLGAGDDGLDTPRQFVVVSNQAVSIEHQNVALLALGHKAEKFQGIAVEPVWVVKGDGSDLFGRCRAYPLPHRQITASLRGFLARSVSILEVFEGQSLELGSPDNGIELLVQGRTTGHPGIVEVADGLASVDEH